MKPLLSIEKRLSAAEKIESVRGKSFVLDYCSRAHVLAYFLSGGMPNEDPSYFELHWSGKPPTSDASKLKVLGQCPSEEIAEVRAEWLKSNWKRDKIALMELKRLEATRALKC